MGRHPIDQNWTKKMAADNNKKNTTILFQNNARTICRCGGISIGKTTTPTPTPTTPTPMTRRGRRVGSCPPGSWGVTHPKPIPFQKKNLTKENRKKNVPTTDGSFFLMASNFSIAVSSFFFVISEKKMVDRVLLLIAAIEATGPEMDRHCWQRSSKKKRNCERTTTAKKSFHLCPTFQPVATSLSTRVLSFFFPQFPTTERLFFGFYRVVNRVFFSSSFFLASFLWKRRAMAGNRLERVSRNRRTRV